MGGATENNRALGEKLLKQARDLRGTLRGQARRAFVLELTGTPKAGKSTSVEILRKFFKEAGFQVHLLKERAADCPLPMKGHFFFNAWTTATMLAEVLETHETNVDLLILDRGFFDALVWLELQSKRHQISPEEKKTFEDFVLLERWRTLVDFTVVVRVDPSVALERENRDQIVPHIGGMMNPKALAEFNEALDSVVRERRLLFSLTEVDTTAAKSVAETNTELLQSLLRRMEEWADPDIAVVPKKVVRELFGAESFLFGSDATDVLKKIALSARAERRSKAEQDPDLVQLIAAGIHIHGEKLMVLERAPTDKKTSDYGQYKLWIGCHVERRVGDGELLDDAVYCLNRRIMQELHLSGPLGQPQLTGLVWNDDALRARRAGDEQPGRHLGIMFCSSITDDYLADHLQDKQFKKMGRSGRLTSAFMTRQQIVEKRLKLESWSDHYVKNIGMIEPEMDRSIQ